MHESAHQRHCCKCPHCCCSFCECCFCPVMMTPSLQPTACRTCCHMLPQPNAAVGKQPRRASCMVGSLSSPHDVMGGVCVCNETARAAAATYLASRHLCLAVCLSIVHGGCLLLLLQEGELPLPLGRLQVAHRQSGALAARRHTRVYYWSCPGASSAMR